LDGDWLWDWAVSEDVPAFGKRGISSSEGKPGAGLAGGRRLLTRGMSASAKSKNARGIASQFDINSANPDLPGAYVPYSTMPRSR
jgi:hypothetical protein